MISRIATHPGKKHCNQCYLWKPRADFVRPSGKEAEKNCNACAAKYRGWSRMSATEKLATRPKRKDPPLTGRVVFVARSHSARSRAGRRSSHGQSSGLVPELVRRKRARKVAA